MTSGRSSASGLPKLKVPVKRIPQQQSGMPVQDINKYFGVQNSSDAMLSSLLALTLAFESCARRQLRWCKPCGF